MDSELILQTEQLGAEGIVRYKLSDPQYIENGWTILPVEKVVRKVNIYRMQPVNPEFDWFERNKNKGVMKYDTGERLAEFDENGRGRWYYRNGRLALDYYDAKENNTQQRFIIYSNGEPDEKGRSHPITVLGLFDFLGNGVILDHSGKVRLKYNQMEGVVLDRGLGPYSHWKWHSLNEPPDLQHVMIDTQLEQKDPTILKLGKTQEDIGPHAGQEDMIAIEFDNFIKEQNKKLKTKFNVFQIKMKALKINRYFSLRILDQTKIYLSFHDGTTTLKLNMGMVLNNEEIIDYDTTDVGKVVTPVDRLPARSDSLASVQRSVAYARKFERSRAQRELNLRPKVEINAKIDHTKAFLSRPLRPPVCVAPSAPSSAITPDTHCGRRKKCTINLYYDTSII